MNEKVPFTEEDAAGNQAKYIKQVKNESWNFLCVLLAGPVYSHHIRMMKMSGRALASTQIYVPTWNLYW